MNLSLKGAIIRLKQ